ncbi:S9 family peptidase [Steroidobacter sp.]|uniref:S9 family peptidase n=1 Tax=Steroidobacter sp. TaxID=1978227 RepID=UPI001A587FEF|nr:prolyl oligopeptidase family serine peptidase [Steroidobacter sp.]MBL8268148.1 S9 family peptidase [Steroidobacter sp.]
MRARLAKLWGLLASLCVAGAAFAQHPVTLDDLFELSVVNQTAVSPDGEWLAAVVIRPVTPGEMYGRTFYEMDVTRADVWLISTKTGDRRNLTQGARDASGFWCATWSPDGKRLAMLSTKPAGTEPRGGDNIRLHVWEKASGTIKRLSPRAMMTQTMGGSALYRVDLRNQFDSAHNAGRCSDEENAPFVWIDDTSLLAVALPQGNVSGLLDAYTRSMKHASATLKSLERGGEPTVSAVESGGAESAVPLNASLLRIDARNARTEEIAVVPAFPLDGDLQIVLAPDAKSAAVLTTTRATAPSASEKFSYPFGSWAVDKQLGFVELAAGSSVRWTSLPATGKYLLDLLSWSNDGSAVAVRARPKISTLTLTMFVASARDFAVTRVSPDELSVAASASGADVPDTSSVIWTDTGGLIAKAVRADEELSPLEYWIRSARSISVPRADWWLLGKGAEPVNLTSKMEHVPASWHRSVSNGRLVGVADNALWTLDIGTGQATRLASAALPEAAEVMWASPPQSATLTLLIAGKGKDGVRPWVRAQIQGDTATVTPLALPSPTARFESYDAARARVLFEDAAPTGTFLWATSAAGGDAKKLLSLNEHMANVALGETRLIEYRGIEGQALKAGVILPPDYVPGRKYPTLLWVYAGATVRGLDSDFFNLYSPGMYNMRLYAAKGYVVMMPSMPLAPDGGKNDDYIDLPKGAMPAVDKLIELGIADPDRLAVMGQSYGGYSTYSLVTYTNRFKAAIAIAGITELVSLYGQFDPTARNYGGIEHQKSANWGLLEHGQVSMGVPPWEDLWRYLRNSPLYFVDRVQTPLLMIHGDQDIRGPMTQAEEFFYALYRQGKRAKLLRYWGEDHGLRQSPANVRNVVDEIVAWLDANLATQNK